ncbi:hypothetical protein DTO166G4_1850 [Paecilomyces variotii]|nr:hypothetical protein DTO166G4_1850 [Paecilomyces variotii]KAJ9239606.1 hypothetical protein DTO166G5_2353 [Paecilomyces variotii]
MTTETTLSYTEEEGMHVLPDGKGLYTKMWKPKSNPPRAVLAFFHGFSDHCNAYYEFFPTLADRGIEVRAVDQRGWGRSVTKPSERGLTGPTTLVLADMHSFLLSLCPSKAPLFVMGHSMGGGQLLTYIFHPESPFNNNQSRPTLSGTMIYSPLIALHPSTRPSMLKVTLGRMAAKHLPRWQLYSPVDANLVSRDPRVCEDYATDELCHDIGTLEGLAGMLDRGLWLEGIATGGQQLHADEETAKRAPPMWFCHGDDDQINLYDATRRFAEVIDAGDKMFKRYKGGYHRLHAEPDGMKDQFVTDVAEWILGKCPAWGNTSSGSRTGSMDGKGDGGLVQGEGDSNIKSPAEDDNVGTRADWTQGMKEVVKPKL